MPAWTLTGQATASNSVLPIIIFNLLHWHVVHTSESDYISGHLNITKRWVYQKFKHLQSLLENWIESKENNFPNWQHCTN